MVFPVAGTLAPKACAPDHSSPMPPAPSLTPEIKALDQPTARAMVQAMLDDVEGNWLIRTPTPTQEQLQWNRRADHTVSICGAMNSVLGSPLPIDNCIACFVAGAPIGFMLIDLDCHLSPWPYIGLMVTHPGSQGAGGLLIEHAVQRSLETGSLGNLTLLAENGDSHAAFEHLGFVPRSDGYLHLEPGTSARWLHVEGRYQLRQTAAEHTPLRADSTSPAR